MPPSNAFILSVLLCGCSTFAAVPQAASREELDAFGVAYDTADSLQRIKSCESFLSRYPKSAFTEKIWQLEFEAFIARADSAAAMRVGRTIIAADPHEAEMFAKLAALFASSLKPTDREQSARFVSRALEELSSMHRPEEMPRERYITWKHEVAARAHAALGELALGKDDAATAVSELQAAVELAPALPGARLLLGMAQFHARNFKASQQSLSASALQNPPSRNALVYLMRDYVALDSLDLDIAERAMSLFPHDVELLFETGQAALDHVRTLARQANSLGRESREFQQLSARKQGKPVTGPVSELVARYDRTAALVSQCYQAVLDDAPNSSYGQRVRGYLAESQNQVAEALANYRAAGDHFAAGRLLAQNTRYEEAATEFKAELSIRPDNHLALAQLSQLYVQLDQSDLASPILDQLLVLYPDDSYAWLDKGRIEQKNGHWQNAANALKKALSLDPTLTQAHYRLATVYLHLRNDAAAENELKLFRSQPEKR